MLQIHLFCRLNYHEKWIGNVVFRDLKVIVPVSVQKLTNMTQFTKVLRILSGSRWPGRYILITCIQSISWHSYKYWGVLFLFTIIRITSILFCKDPSFICRLNYHEKWIGNVVFRDLKVIVPVSVQKLTHVTQSYSKESSWKVDPVEIIVQVISKINLTIYLFCPSGSR